MQANVDPLSPNTSALLAYFASVSNPSQQQGNTLVSDAMSIQPSALWTNPAPANGVADSTPSSSSAAASVSPDALQAVPLNASDSEGEAPAGHGVARRKSSAGATHKRKAGHGHTVEELSDEDEDSESEVPSGHEDKRQTKSNAARRGRKSTDNAETGKSGKELSKAARRKEQNRAAQKAFRERREAKVKDLEDKVAELEGKAYTTGVENENLRGILKRLQEENVALKQSAFTFSMPVNNKSPSGTSTPINNVNAAYRPQSSKPPSPPHSVDDTLRSINEPAMPNRKVSGMGGASPESLVSVSSRSPDEAKSHPTFDQAFNNLAAGSAWAPTTQNSQQSFSELLATLSRSNSSVSPSSNASNNMAEIEALWASFYPKGPVDTTNNTTAGQGDPAQRQQPSQQQPAVAPQPQAQAQKSVGPGPSQDMAASSNSFFNFFAPQIGPHSSAAPKGIDKMAFRDPAAPQAAAPAPPVASPQDIDWSKFAENSDMDFLNSILGTNNADSTTTANAGGSGSFSADDEFQRSLNALLQQSAGGSPSEAFALPNTATGYSPTTYLNMSPSPLASISNSQSPASILNSASQSGTPESSGSSMPSTSSEVFVDPPSTFNASQHKPGEVVRIIDATGKVMKPSEVWVKMGMPFENNVDDLVIDDLCDQMRSKAQCKDGQISIKYSDAETMFRQRNTPQGKAEYERLHPTQNANGNMSDGYLKQADMITTTGL